MLQRTRQGNWIYAVGGDKNAARNVGVPVRRTKVSMFVTVSLAAALVGTINAVELTSVSAGQGTGYEFYYIIAAVVGGTLMTGGAGSVIGASLGRPDPGHDHAGDPVRRMGLDLALHVLRPHPLRGRDAQHVGP